METIVWLAIMVAAGFLLWLAAPHHQRMIANRDIPTADKPTSE